MITFEDPNSTVRIVYEILKEHPDLTIELINFHAIGKLQGDRLQRKKLVASAVYRLSKEKMIKKDYSKPAKWSIVENVHKTQKEIRKRKVKRIGEIRWKKKD